MATVQGSSLPLDKAGRRVPHIPPTDASDLIHTLELIRKRPALDALAQALASPVGPRDWTRFCRWAKTLNPLPPLLVQAYNRSLVQDEYQKLRQGEQETAEHFYHRFTHWELRAMYHHCNYEPRSAFLECLNAHLRPKVCSRMDDFKRYNLPIVFGDVVTAALNEDSSE
ncbi:hypothetical protein PtA15_3A395 [Puccinia triticina]|uniref:Retrotransposon gag domain-containing protein n=1 Tax=Puccinia triticina TaxID=208348 RepID=A0ABY7CD92_9BASI|nr:uncharacterized protein PtA15_3A395 [Puccinia triticina]WAQ83029.1 hypothetical protein PtA15_3A395 [Puccinia triticina]WAR53863.1 hypothetical protein PtB15_3B372 [Puccinia triticina]